jgi:hypothetical protein
MIPPECERFGEKAMRQLNNSARDRMQNRMPVLLIPPHRLSRTIGATPAENNCDFGKTPGRRAETVIPGRCEASNPESRDSPMRNCASEVWSCGPSRNDGYGFTGSLKIESVAKYERATFSTVITLHRVGALRRPMTPRNDDRYSIPQQTFG